MIPTIAYRHSARNFQFVVHNIYDEKDNWCVFGFSLSFFVCWTIAKLVSQCFVVLEWDVLQRKGGSERSNAVSIKSVHHPTHVAYHHKSFSHNCHWSRPSSLAPTLFAWAKTILILSLKCKFWTTVCMSKDNPYTHFHTKSRTWCFFFFALICSSGPYHLSSCLWPYLSRWLAGISCSFVFLLLHANVPNHRQQ